MDEVNFEVHFNGEQFCATDDLGGVGFGSTYQEAISDLTSNYEDVMEVFDIEFEPI